AGRAPPHGPLLRPPCPRKPHDPRLEAHLLRLPHHPPRRGHRLLRHLAQPPPAQTQALPRRLLRNRAGPAGRVRERPGPVQADGPELEPARGVYGAMHGSVFYKDQRVGPVRLTGPFDQGPKSTKVLDEVLTVSGRRWDRSRGKVAFRLDVTATVMFRVSTWRSETHRMHANCDVDVGPEGSILPSFKSKRYTVKKNISLDCVYFFFFLPLVFWV
ncbi:unnamed protein product, partial [Linum tenue]